MISPHAKTSANTSISSPGTNFLSQTGVSIWVTGSFSMRETDVLVQPVLVPAATHQTRNPIKTETPTLKSAFFID